MSQDLIKQRESLFGLDILFLLYWLLAEENPSHFGDASSLLTRNNGHGSAAAQLRSCNRDILRGDTCAFSHTTQLNEKTYGANISAYKPNVHVLSAAGISLMFEAEDVFPSSHYFLMMNLC